MAAECFHIWGRERWLEAKINDSNLHKFEEKIISVSDHGKGGTLKLNQEVRGGVIWYGDGRGMAWARRLQL